MSLPAFPTSQKGDASAPTVNKAPSKQGSGSRSYTNFRSAITAVRTHIYYSLVAVMGIFIGTLVAIVTSILVQSVSVRPHTPLYAQVMMLVLISIAGVSCITGGLVMMSTLLVAISGRSREFSVRLAVGARRRDMRAQILWEAFLLSAVGGIAGGACGLLVGFVLTLTLQMPFSVNPAQVAILIGISVILGVIFALYPGQRVTRLDYGKVLRTG